MWDRLSRAIAPFRALLYGVVRRRSARRGAMSFTACALLALAPLALAQPAPDRLRNPDDLPELGDATSGEHFGASIALDGDTLAVGSIQARDDWNRNAGAVRVFVRQGGRWILQAKLFAPDRDSWDGFGAALALQGDTLVIGASNVLPDTFGNYGAAYLFERKDGVWSCAQTLVSRSLFPVSAVALDQDVLAIGASRQAVYGFTEAGSVSVFARENDGWHARQTLLPSFSSKHAMFGSSLALARGALLVGAYGENEDSGAVYAFSLETDGRFALRQRLSATAPLASDMLGMAMASDGDRLLAGAPAYLQWRGGRVVEWQRDGDTWYETRTIEALGDWNVRHFGSRIAQRAGRWVVGADHHSDFAMFASIDAYAYASNGADLALTTHTSIPYTRWDYEGLAAIATDGVATMLGLPDRNVAPWSDAGEVRVIEADGAQSSIHAGVTATYELFGSAVEATGDWLFVGAPGERVRSGRTGAVFVYDRHASMATPAAVLAAPDGVREGQFGVALARSGATVLVGAPESGLGRVHLYEYDGTGFVERERWTAPGNALSFGRALDADASAAIVGAPSEETGPNNTYGAAYVYERAAGGWLAPARLDPGATDPWELVGNAVAIDGTTAVVGSVKLIFDGTGPWTDGVARVYERAASGWIERARLTRPPTEQVNARFAEAVAVSGDWIFVGAPLAQDVHVYRRDGGEWKWTQRIELPRDASYSLSQRLRVIDGELWAASIDGSGRGSVTLYRYRAVGGVWSLVQAIGADPVDSGGSYEGDFAVDGHGGVFIGVPDTRGYAPFVGWAGVVRLEEADLFDSGFED